MLNRNLPLGAGTRSDEYLNKLQQYLPSFLSQIYSLSERLRQRPKIAFYNAGTDIYEDDPIGRLKISAEGILARDRLVFQTLVAAIPVVMVLSGGYTCESYQLVARSVGDVGKLGVESDLFPK